MKAALGHLLNSFGLLLPVFHGIEFMQTLGADKVVIPRTVFRFRRLASACAWWAQRTSRGFSREAAS